MRKLICFIIICITSILLIHKPIKKIYVVKAEIIDLTNTTWTFNNSINFNYTETNETFNINFYVEINNDTITYDYINYRITEIFDDIDTSYWQLTIKYLNSSDSSINATVYTHNIGDVNNDIWAIQDFKTINIRNGIDTTNTNLITWLETNATIQNNITYIELSTPTLTGTLNIINWDDVYSNYSPTYKEYEIWKYDPEEEEYFLLDQYIRETTYTITQGYGYYKIKAYYNDTINNTLYYSELSNTYEYVQRPLQTPTITQNLYTISWNNITGANYYEIYKDNELYQTTQNTEFTVIENGNYKIKAIPNQNTLYLPSTYSNTIEINTYNNLIGNGFNFFSMFTAIIDAQVYLIESFLNYEIWGINFYDVFKLLITISLIIIIIKFAIKQKG